jgi:hypothetical protein
VEIQPHHVYLFDIDGTVCNSDEEFERWKSFCQEITCTNLEDSPEDHRFCKLINKARCVHEGLVAQRGIFGKEAIRKLPSVPKARDFLQRVDKEAQGHFVSGRLESHRLPTIDWLEEHGFPSFRLWLRLDHDTRSIPQVKEEMIFTIMTVYGNPEEEWILVDDDPRMEEVCKILNISYVPAGEAF